MKRDWFRQFIKDPMKLLFCLLLALCLLASHLTYATTKDSHKTKGHYFHKDHYHDPIYAETRDYGHYHHHHPPYYPEEHEHGKHDYDFLLPILLLLIAPLAVSAFMLPITASLMTNSMFLVNGFGGAAAAVGRKKRDIADASGTQHSTVAQTILEIWEAFEEAFDKYAEVDGSSE